MPSGRYGVIIVWYNENVMDWSMIGAMAAVVSLLLAGSQALTVWVIKRYISRYEEQNRAEHAELKSDLKEHGRTLANLRVEVGKLTGLVDRDALDTFRRAIVGSAKSKPTEDD